MRERGVPRYNQFRRLLHLKPFDTFEEMADTPEHAEELRRIYGDVERVDTMIGMYAERKPKGFGFSDTAFRIFILMASRRLESDRFFTRDYRPEVYTPEGLDWVENNDMRRLLLRHFPELEPALQGVENPFAPWERAPRDGDRARRSQPRPREGRARAVLAGAAVPDRRRRGRDVARALRGLDCVQPRPDAARRVVRRMASSTRASSRRRDGPITAAQRTRFIPSLVIGRPG